MSEHRDVTHRVGLSIWLAILFVVTAFETAARRIASALLAIAEALP